MMPQKTQQSSLLQKIEVIESNTSRLQNQHESLQKLLDSSQIKLRLKNNIDHLNQTLHNVEAMEEKYIEAIEKKLPKSENSLKERINYEHKQVWQMCEKLKAKINNHKEEKVITNKKIKKELQAKIINIQNANLQEIKDMQTNVTHYLNNTKKELQEKYQQQALQRLSQLILEESPILENEIEANLGLLQCEIEYVHYLKNRKRIETTCNINQNKANIHTASKAPPKELQIGKFERDCLIMETEETVKQTLKRLTYDVNLLHKKIETAIECINGYKNNSKSWKIIEYQIELKQLFQRFEKIEMEFEGIMFYINQSLHQLRVLNTKVKYLDSNEEETHLSLQKSIESFGGKYQECYQKLIEFEKLQSILEVN